MNGAIGRTNLPRKAENQEEEEVRVAFCHRFTCVERVSDEVQLS